MGGVTDEERRKILKDILKQLHEGGSSGTS
jgi:DUF438 domain-containing protein